MSRSDVTSEHEIEQLIAVAERKRRGQRKVLEDGLDHDAIDTEAVEEETTKRVRRRPKLKAEEQSSHAGDEQKTPRPGFVTRGIHAGLNGAQKTRNRLVQMGLWGCAAALITAVLLVFSFYAIDKTPAPLAVTGFQVQWLPGPKIPDADVMTWVRSFPYASQLRGGDPKVLAALAEHLRKQPIVSEIREVGVVHVPMAAHPDTYQRKLNIVLALRQPVMPVVLASGARGWIDNQGYLLPGTMPGPTVRRPVLRQIEWAGINGVKAALQMWKLIEAQVESGLITDIYLYDVLDQRGTQRGIVLYTRHGSRLIWGRPGDDRYGIKPEDKVRDLVHSMRSQGNVSRVAAINVRFKEPYFVLRDQPYATSQP